MQTSYKLKKQVRDGFEMMDMDDVSRVTDMNVARDPKKGTITINQRDYAEDVIERLNIRASTPRIRLVCDPSYS